MSSNEKTPYPPAYTEIYPAVPANEVTAADMGWTAPATTTVTQPQQPVYMTQPAVTNIVMRNQSRVGQFPVKLQPCPHCHTECKTEVRQEATLRTHLLAFILCVTCCCCCIPLAYMKDNQTKVANHFCENCKAYIGSYSRKICCC